MNIVPISTYYPMQTSSVPGAAPASTQGGGTTVPFKNIFQQALANVQETQAQVDRDNYNLALGDVDDLAAIGNNLEKAEIAMQMLVQMRNQVLDAYNEIMRLNV